MTAPTPNRDAYDPTIDPIGDFARECLVRQAGGIAGAVRAPQGASEHLRAYGKDVRPRSGCGHFVAKPGEPVGDALLDLVESSGPDAIGPVAYERGERGIGLRQLVEGDLRGNEFGFRVEAHEWASWVGRHRLWLGLGGIGVTLVLAHALSRREPPAAATRHRPGDDDRLTEAFRDHPAFLAFLRRALGSDAMIRLVLRAPNTVAR